ncbi:LysR substrate-binding domain-containing protein [Janthinobacterium fluminis]|uniref:LysR substrate-binding domain-containing protein n=1 Tax=Janthinobacterium fluminis TaxID=2987524 RepID=A0ABT5JVS0_9BURK|nr:LysR substrate-binding domain-containing protein [Janthinobacterium fluminis]MDC8756176.1 LysR substrate-binding domain-containing protein [Janthinobacterium fluminis]
MTSHAPSLNAIRMFEVAARHLSFVRAAEELHLTHGAVSRQIRLLEDTLGVALFERRNRAVFLTREGAAFQLTCADVMARLASGIRAIQQAGESALVLSCEPTLAMRWLIPRLGAFRERFPRIELHLVAAGGPVDFRRGHVDLALRRNDFQWGTDCHAEPVAREWTAPVCAPALLEAGQLHLERHCQLHTASRPDAWPCWGAASGRATPASRTARYEHFYLSLQAAGAGLGVAIGSVYMVGEELANGRLVAPAGFVEDGSDYYLLSPTPFAGDARRLDVLGWLREELAATRARGVDGDATK